MSVATCSPGEGGADDATEGSGCDDGAAVGLDTSSTGLGARTEGTVAGDDAVDGAGEGVTVLTSVGTATGLATSRSSNKH